MKNKDKILQLIRQKGKITSSEITSAIGVSRQYVNMVISDLVAEKEAVKLGGTRNAFYVSKDYISKHSDIVPNVFKKLYKNESIEEHKILLEIEERFPKLAQLPENVRNIFTFAFSEMFNNAIEHSQSKSISVEVAVRDKDLSFIVNDSGVGVFRNIMKKRNLKSEIQAIQDLLKGKTTTMPKSHSGEGIFFTSKSGDVFILDSFGYQLAINTIKSDVSIHRISLKKRGTRVIFRISANSSRHLNDIFKKYTNLVNESDYGFDKTEIRVKLFTAGGIHISRSQARRVLAGLEKFKIILFDYENVPMVGQAFADEIYRVFQERHPDIRLENENTSEGVRFMIERAINEAKKSK
ncbi:ATP-binding protein [Patescibacteria group bacterium]|nr:ATP-binding protein [Patescibacteria group bacterium]MBU4057519.1 ATP-binding protein [Patescibacteria group bacterium]MBU4115720.1 ATP-binding protein [Patescibacteria group bacterium]